MEFLEKDLEDIMQEMHKRDKGELNNRGLFVDSERTLLRQKRIGNYGVADLIGVRKEYPLSFKNGEPCYDLRNSFLNITVYELKKDRIGVSAFFQAIGYARGIQSYLEGRNFNNFFIDIVLIGYKLDKSGSLCAIPSLIGNYCDTAPSGFGFLRRVLFYEYRYGIDGITFEQQESMSLPSEGF